jgi:hypothetical protein
MTRFYLLPYAITAPSSTWINSMIKAFAKLVRRPATRPMNHEQFRSALFQLVNEARNGGLKPHAVAIALDDALRVVRMTGPPARGDEFGRLVAAMR